MTSITPAYDATAFETQNEHRLVWRARLTVNAQAVAMNEALPPLVLTASSVFGRDMSGPEIVMRKLRRGAVTLAPMEILEAAFKDSAAQFSNCGAAPILPRDSWRGG